MVAETLRARHSQHRCGLNPTVHSDSRKLSHAKSGDSRNPEMAAEAGLGLTEDGAGTGREGREGSAGRERERESGAVTLSTYYSMSLRPVPRPPCISTWSKEGSSWDLSGTSYQLHETIPTHSLTHSLKVTVIS